MKTEWDYTALAQAYLKRADYAPEAIDQLLRLTGVSAGDRVCDVGAGAAHLTLPLLDRGLTVVAVEPNDAMRANGAARTAGRNVEWIDGTGEHTGRSDREFALVTFGSSFNVTDRPAALKESARILRPQGWFACLWNHRDVDDPLQQKIEQAIRARIPQYEYGTRRDDQEAVISASGLFGPVSRIEGVIVHRQRIDDCLEAWRSHATLRRQAGSDEQFRRIVADIEMILARSGGAAIDVPYTTRVWAAQVKN